MIFKKVLQSKASRTFWMIFTDGIIFGANFTLYLVYFATLCYTKLVQFYLPPIHSLREGWQEHLSAQST